MHHSSFRASQEHLNEDTCSLYLLDPHALHVRGRHVANECFHAFVDYRSTSRGETLHEMFKSYNPEKIYSKLRIIDFIKETHIYNVLNFIVF